MSDDLVTRLRDAVNGEHDMTPHGADCLQAAARIAADAVTIARLTGRMEHWRRESDRAIHELTARAQLAEQWRDHDKERAEAAEAKLAALVEAMREIVQHCQNSGRGSELVDGRIVERCEETARAAVTASKGAK